MAKKKKHKKAFRFILWISVFLSAVILLVCLGSRSFILSAAEGCIYANADTIPENRVGLVLGCSPIGPSGDTNLFFLHRMDAAAELYKAGKVQYLIVSGDNHIKTYNEPSAMRAALIERGVPEERIICDYAGLRTLDSIIRANKIFGQSKITIISQQFHNQRAVFIAQHNGMEAIGYNADEVTGAAGWKINLREAFARTKAVLDIYLLKKQPRHLGEPIQIGEEQP